MTTTRHHSGFCPLLLLLSLAAPLGGCAAMSYASYRLAPDYPEDRSQTIELDGLSAPVRISLDRWGVAHLEATDEADLLRAVGFVQARDRFFQMDTLRRFARGRLSELVGQQRLQFGSSVELDATMRGWGFDELAEQDARSLDAEHRRLMEAYTAGVNAARRRHPPVEYRLLGLEPEPWTIADSFAVGRLVGWSISHNWHQELSRLLIALWAGIDRAEAIYPSEPWPGSTSVALSDPTHPLPPAVAPEIRSLFPGRGSDPDWRGAVADRGLETTLSAFGAASNAWVLAGDRSASGKPLLANDPHMSHLVPSLMYQQHLRCGDLDVIGVTAPGLPYVLIGHNRRVAWGMTSAVGDVIDLYLERPVAGHPDQVQGPAGPQPLVRSERVIRVRVDGKLVERRFALRSTPRGPLVNDLYPDLLPAWAPLVSLRWDSQGAGDSIRALRLANRATDVAELRRRLLGMVTPVNSVMAADVDGTIALFPTGKLPLRRGHRGTFPAPAWLAAYGWAGRVAPDDMPLFEDPPAGFFAHGNNLMYDPARLAVLLGIDSAPAYRLERITELLGAGGRLTADDMQRMQLDVRLGRARSLLPPMLADLQALGDGKPGERPALELLAAWDGQATVDSPAAAIFFVTYRQAMIGAMADEVPPRQLAYLLSQRYFTNAVDLWYRSADNPVWDDRTTERRELRGDVIRAAFRRAVRFLRESQGAEPQAWRWGALHDQQARHPFGAKLPAFNLERFEARGGPDAVWKSHLDFGDPAHPFRAVAGPVYRMVLDLADLDHGRWIIDTGASGWPFSPHYADQYARWQRGELVPMLMNWDEIHAQAVAVLSLEPPD